VLFRSNALAGKLSDAVQRITAAVTGQQARISALELKVITLIGELEQERRARLAQVDAIHDHFVQVEKSIETLEGDLDELTDELYCASCGECGACEEDDFPTKQCGCEDCCPDDAVPCKMSILNRTEANEAFKQAFEEIKTEVEKERFASKVKKAKKGRKGKKS
jgi:hypothetical protein